MGQVLLIEPDRLLAENIAGALRRSGHRVDWQVEPQAATDSADRQKPDIIILELLLAGRSGVEFLYELRSYPDWRSLPVIIFSDVRPAEVAPSLASLNQLNIAAYHHKPATTLEQLSQSVDGILQK